MVRIICRYQENARHFKERMMVRLILFGLMLMVVMPAKAEQKHFTMGVVPQFEARELHEIWQPILHFLSDQTGHRFELKGAPNIPAFEKALLAGEFDLVYTAVLTKNVKFNLGYSHMFATDAMEAIKGGGDKSTLNNWAWAMIAWHSCSGC